MESLFTFTTEPGPCEYLPDQEWSLQYEVMGQLTAAEYQDRMKTGWRRFGYSLFRPVCPACRKCLSIRVPVATFQPDRSQRRALAANDGEVTLAVGPPAATKAKLKLYKRFHQFQHESKGWPAPVAYTAIDYAESFVDNPFPTEEWCYYLDDRLIGVGYVDALPEGLSAIYFFYDPDERDRSLGTYNVLSVIRGAAQRNLQHVYLGYYVEGCRSLEYKARFRPNEVLNADGQWRPFLE
jgi:arginine-tRNA-protein transferase